MIEAAGQEKRAAVGPTSLGAKRSATPTNPTQPALSPLLTSRETAQALYIHRNTLQRLSPEELPFFRVVSRGDRRYRREDVEAYLSRRQAVTE